MRLAEIANLVILGLLPVAWSAPLISARLLPFFGAEEISILSGLAELTETAPLLAALVALFALAAPLGKGLALAAVFRGVAPARTTRVVEILGRLAMADVFLVAVYIVAAKGVGVGTVRPEWGLWLFTALVLGGMAVARAAASDARVQR